MPNEQSKRQVLLYNFQKNKWAIAALALFILDAACVLLIGIVDSLIMLALMAVLSAACLFCALHIKETSRTEQLAVVDNPAPIDTDILTENMHDSVKVIGRDGNLAKDTVECFIVSEELNRRFVLRPLWARVSEDPYRLPEPVLPFVAYLKDYRNQSLAQVLAIRPDKAVAGLAGDITVDMFDDEHPEVKVDIPTRYSVQVTDDAFNKLIINKKRISDKVVFDGRSLALDDKGRLDGFSSSKICNEMDIQSLIISSDGYMMIAQGTEEHPLCPGEIVPSASCSLLPDEIEDRPLQESMISSIHAKIHTLFDIPDDVDMKSSFCGMTRMVMRGGAPEFYCLTLIDMDKDALLSSHKDSSTVLVPDIIGNRICLDEEAFAISIQEATNEVMPRKDLSLSASAAFFVARTSAGDCAVARKILCRLGIVEKE